MLWPTLVLFSTYGPLRLLIALLHYCTFFRLFLRLETRMPSLFQCLTQVLLVDANLLPLLVLILTRRSHLWSLFLRRSTQIHHCTRKNTTHTIVISSEFYLQWSLYCPHFVNRKPVAPLVKNQSIPPPAAAQLPGSLAAVFCILTSFDLHALILVGKSDVSETKQKPIIPPKSAGVTSAGGGKALQRTTSTSPPSNPMPSATTNVKPFTR